MRVLLAAVCVVFLSACGTSYKVAPTNRKSDEHAAKVSQHISNADVRAKSNKKRVQSAAAKVVVSEKQAVKVVDDINAAIASLDLKDYPAVGHALIQAKIDAGILLGLYEALKDDLRIVEKDNDDLIIDLDLGNRENEKVKAENKKFQDIVDQAAEREAKLQAIVDEVNWGFRVGSLFYFVKGILKIGFFGIIILVVVGAGLAIAAMIFGGPFAGFIWRLFSGIWALIRNRKPNK